MSITGSQDHLGNQRKEPPQWQEADDRSLAVFLHIQHGSSKQWEKLAVTDVLSLKLAHQWQSQTAVNGVQFLPFWIVVPSLYKMADVLLSENFVYNHYLPVGHSKGFSSDFLSWSMKALCLSSGSRCDTGSFVFYKRSFKDPYGLSGRIQGICSKFITNIIALQII